MAQTMEDTTAAWGGVYLREELGAAAAVSGLGFIALQSTQTVGRLLGDRVVTATATGPSRGRERRSPASPWPRRSRSRAS